MALLCAVIGLMLLYGACGFALMPASDLSFKKRQTANPDEAAHLDCLVKELMAGTISRDCIQGIVHAAPDKPAEVKIGCSSTCDSLYLAVVKCAGQETTRQLYSKECTNGYMGPTSV